MLKPALQRGKDTKNPSPLTRSHRQLPGAAAQPAEPRPNPASRGAQRVHSPPNPWGRNTAKLNATANSSPEDHTECGPVRAPAQGRQKEEQAAPPPPPKRSGGEGGGAKTAHSHQTARQHHQRRPNPPTRKAPKTGPRKRHRGTTQPKPATPSQEQRPTGKRDTETCRHTPRKKKKEPAAQPERKGNGGQGPQGPGQGHPATDTTKPKKKKQKAQQTHPDNPAKKGGAQPRPGPRTHARTAHRNRKRRGASEARTKPHTSQKQAET